MMSESFQLVVFTLGGQCFAVSAANVLRVVAVAQWAPLPGTPNIVLGILDYHGEVIPVLDPRYRIAGSSPAVSLADQLIIVRTRHRVMALLVNETLGVIAREAADVSSLDLKEFGSEQFAGTTTLDDGIVLIHDLERFLSPNEARALDLAIERSCSAASQGPP